MVDVYAVKLDKDFDENRFEKLIQYTSDDKRKRIQRFYRFEDAQRTLIGDILIRYLICKKFGMKNSQLKFGENKFGKPFSTNSPDFHFNISHAGEWVVCATHFHPVGIDIELIKPIQFSISDRFFSYIEQNDLLYINDIDKLSYFYDLWTLKESYVKAIGKGLSMPLDSFSIRIINNMISIITESSYKNCFFKQFYINEGYKMAVCAYQDDFNEKIELLKVDKLDKLFEGVLLT